MQFAVRKKRVRVASALFALVLLVSGTALFIYRSYGLQVPIIPDRTYSSWLIEAKLNFASDGRPARITLQAPQRGGAHEILTENFVSAGFSLGAASLDGAREILWSRTPPAGEYRLYYQALVRRVSSDDQPPLMAGITEKTVKFTGERRELVQSLFKQFDELEEQELKIKALLEKIEQTGGSQSKILYKDSKSDGALSDITVARRALETVGISTRLVHGLEISEPRRNAPLFSWLEILVGDEWKSYDYSNQRWGPPEDSFAWWRGERSLLKTRGIRDEKLTLSVTPGESSAKQYQLPTSAMQSWFSLYSLSAESQTVYRLLLLLPLGALVITFLRSIIGIRTFGTFMPVLIALSFRDTKLFNGLLLFISVVSLGLVARYFFEKLKLLIVPRLAATLTLVIVIAMTLSTILDQYGYELGMNVALFPMVILTMTIERMSIIWDELGAIQAIRQGIVSLFAATLAYLVVSEPLIEYVMFSFPELLLVILGVTVLLGRYTGYRLMELYRFRSLTRKEKSV